MHKYFLRLRIPKREMEAVENTIREMEQDHTPIYVTLREQLGTQIQTFAAADNYLTRILQRNGIATLRTIQQSVPAHHFPSPFFFHATDCRSSPMSWWTTGREGRGSSENVEKPPKKGHHTQNQPINPPPPSRPQWPPSWTQNPWCKNTGHGIYHHHK